MLRHNGKPDKRYNKKGITNDTIVNKTPIYPTKYGFVQYEMLPVRIVDGCVCTGREGNRNVNQKSM